MCATSTLASARIVAAASFGTDRKSTRLNSSHMSISYAVFCLKKKKVDDDVLAVEIGQVTVQHIIRRDHAGVVVGGEDAVGVAFVLGERPALLPCVFFFNDTATTEIYTLSLHDALPI